MATLFDLNIEEVLDHWMVEHAIREVISNALDEQLLTGSPEPEIFQDASGVWHIRDFGRGLAIQHFTLKESTEKQGGPPGIIGKFGVGLKDALATFHRRGIEVVIRSPLGVYRLLAAKKHNFDSITTLHVEHEPGDPNMEGTDFALRNVTGSDMAAAKSLFLRFSGDGVVETTEYGQILSRIPGPARIYISGVFANEEANFLFSYNITSLTDSMKKRLNRERLNVGRTTYAERVKSILKSASSEVVLDALADQVGARARGDQADEMAWTEISTRAMNLLHERRRVAFVSEHDLADHPDVIDNMRREGISVVLVDESQKSKLDAQVRAGDESLRTLEGYVRQYNDSFAYSFVDPSALSSVEAEVLGHSAEILGLIGADLGKIPIRVSETIRVSLDGTAGVWDNDLGAIVIKRSELRSLDAFAGTLLHEAAHVLTGALDATRFFESILTDYLGRTAERALTTTRS